MKNSNNFGETVKTIVTIVGIGILSAAVSSATYTNTPSTNVNTLSLEELENMYKDGPYKKAKNLYKAAMIIKDSYKTNMRTLDGIITVRNNTITVQSFAGTTTYTYRNGLINDIRVSYDNITIFRYDYYNRLVGISYGDGESAEFQYDVYGRLIQEKEGRICRKYEYNTRNQITSITDNDGKIVYDYDVYGNLRNVVRR